MNNEITLEDIKYYQQLYNKDENNKQIENDILSLGIREACSTNKENYEFKFNIEVPRVRIYYQFDSNQCNIYSSLRMIKDILRQNSDLAIDFLDISASYIAFYDKLEKVNTYYDELINCKNISMGFINTKIDKYIGSYGTFYFCKKIIDKYGIVPTKDMKEVDENYDDSLTIELLKNKIKTDSLILREIKDIDERRKIKKGLIFEAYQFLSKIYGNPPTIFEIKGELLTPNDFKDKYLKNYLDDYVTTTLLPKNVLFDSYSFVPSMYLADKEEIITLPKEELENAILKQLQDGISIWFSAEESTTLDSKNGILDYDAYCFNKKLKIREISKNDKMKLDIINYDHAMCITGALFIKNQIVQYKVDNSFGDVGKFNGNLIMTPSFLENCVITLILNKKYINMNEEII